MKVAANKRLEVDVKIFIKEDLKRIADHFEEGEMDSIAVLLQHNGQWDQNKNYINFDVCGIVIRNDFNYNNLIGMICNELKLQLNSTLLTIQYQVKDGYPPLKIVDDSQLKFYIELKKKETNFTKYPLCLTIEFNSMQQSFFSTRSTTTHNQPCNEVAQTEEAASNSDDEPVDYLGDKEVADFIDYAELVSNQIIEMIDERNINNEEEVIDIDDDLVITNNRHQEIALSQIYKDKETLKTVLSHYAINNHFQYCVQKSCKKEYLVACLDKNCKWMLRASRNENTNQFIIRKFSHIHTCALEIRLKDQRQATSTIIADMIKHKFTNIKTKYTAADIVRDLKHDHEVQVKYSKARRSREKAIEKVRGKAVESYAELPSYLYMLHHTNPGSYIELKSDEDGMFLYAFVALNASMKGWPHCIPVVIVDGTFLKSTYGGTLLVSATQDAEGKIFPLAFCVVD
ncbi:uncharacterized protein LOC133822494 [Humulus lupulus]|uniref:uncharacterized protein LOC133822494 n=1 Tax=Humulus lupulus TaxID=3486 RepID=UPI002B4134BB|nr:uncharacterized protein LOC133822494 [Humulus lupulus]